MSRLRSVPALRSPLWNSIDDPGTVKEAAQAEVALLHGLAKLSGGAAPIEIGTIFQFDARDALVDQTRESVNQVHVLAREFATPDVFVGRLGSTRTSDALAGAVIELSGAADWYKLFKAVEYLEEYFGGGERDLIRALPAEKAFIKKVKETSQALRHRARAYGKVVNPLSLLEAEKGLARIVTEMLDERGSKHKSDQSRYAVVNREYPAQEQIGLRPLVLLNGQVAHVAFVGDTLDVSEESTT